MKDYKFVRDNLGVGKELADDIINKINRAYTGAMGGRRRKKRTRRKTRKRKKITRSKRKEQKENQEIKKKDKYIVTILFSNLIYIIYF